MHAYIKESPQRNVSDKKIKKIADKIHNSKNKSGLINRILELEQEQQNYQTKTGDLQKQIKKSNLDLSNTQAERDTYKLELEKAKQEQQKYQTKTENLQKQIEKSNLDLNNTQVEGDTYKLELEQAKQEQQKYQTKTEDLQKQIEKSNLDLNNTQVERDTYKLELEKAKQEQQNYQTKNEDLQKQIEALLAKQKPTITKPYAAKPSIIEEPQLSTKPTVPKQPTESNVKESKSNLKPATKPTAKISSSKKLSEIKIQSDIERDNSYKILFSIMKEWIDQKRFYPVLNISEDASPEEIKLSYKKLSILLHPDLVRGKTKDLATQILSNLNVLKKPILHRSKPGSLYPEDIMQNLRENCQKTSQILKDFLEQNKDTPYVEYQEEDKKLSSDKTQACREYNDYILEKSSEEGSYENIMRKNLPYDVSQKRTLEEEMLIKEAQSKVTILNKATIQNIKDFVAIQDLSCDKECRSNNKIANPYVVKELANSLCINGQELNQIFLEEKLTQAHYNQFSNAITNFNNDYIQLNGCSNSFAIPKIIHSIIFISRECKNNIECIKTSVTIKTNNLLKIAIKEGWSYNLWINPVSIDIESEIVNIIAPSINLKFLNESNLEIKSFENEIAWKMLVASRIWGSSYPELATNLAKFLVIGKYGGVYQNYNYQISDNSLLEKLSCNYNSFFLTKKQNDVYQIDDHFFAAAANHSIINDVVNIIGRNIFKIVDAPSYIKYPCDSNIRIEIMSGHIPLSISFGKNHQQQDVILSYDQPLIQHNMNTTDTVGQVLVDY